MSDQDRVTVDLQERIAEIDQELAAIEEEAQEIQAAETTDVDDLDPEDLKNLVDAENFDALVQRLQEAFRAGPNSEEYQQLREDYEELAQARETLEAKIEEWGGSEFAIKTDIDWSSQTLANDMIRSDLNASREAHSEAQFGVVKRRVVQVYVTETPPDAPDEPGEYPPVVGEFLYEKVDNVTRFGEAEVGNWRLDQAIGRTE